MLYFHTAPLHFMETKAHFIPFFRPCKVQYISIHWIQPPYWKKNEPGHVRLAMYSTHACMYTDTHPGQGTDQSLNFEDQ